MLLSVSQRCCCQRKGRGCESAVATPAENNGLSDRRGNVGEPSMRRTEGEQEVTGDFSAGKIGSCCPQGLN